MVPLADALSVPSQLPSGGALLPPAGTERAGERRSFNGVHRATVPALDASASSVQAPDGTPAWLDEAQRRLSLGAGPATEMNLAHSCAPSAAARQVDRIAAGSTVPSRQASAAPRDARGGPRHASLPEQLRKVLGDWARSKLDQCIPSSISDAVLGQNGTGPEGGGGGPVGGGEAGASEPNGGSMLGIGNMLGMAASIGGDGPSASRVEAIRRLVGAGEFEEAAQLASGDDELMGWVGSARQASERLVHQAMSRQFEALLECGRYEEAAYFVRTPAQAVRISRLIARDTRRLHPDSPGAGRSGGPSGAVAGRSDGPQSCCGANPRYGSAPGGSMQLHSGISKLGSSVMEGPAGPAEPPLEQQLQRLEQQQQAHGDGEPAIGRRRHESMVGGRQRQGQQAGPQQTSQAALAPTSSAGQRGEWPAEEWRRPGQARGTEEEAWVLYEQRRAQWLQYYIESGDVDRALNLCLTPRERARVLSASRLRVPWLPPQGPVDGSNEAYGTDGEYGTGVVESGSTVRVQPLGRFNGTPPGCGLNSI